MTDTRKRQKTGNKPADFMLSFADSHIESLAEEISDSIKARKQIRRLSSFVDSNRPKFTPDAAQATLGAYMAGQINTDAVSDIAANFDLFEEDSPIGLLFRKFVPNCVLLENCYGEAQPSSGFVALTMLLELVPLTDEIKGSWDIVVSGVENEVSGAKVRIDAFEQIVNRSMLATQFASKALSVD